MGRCRTLDKPAGSADLKASEASAARPAALPNCCTFFEPHANLLRSGDSARFKTGTISGVRSLMTP